MRTAPSEGDKRSILDRTIVASAALFVSILALAAYWDRSVRVLHVFEAIPYVAAAVLGARRSKVGYAVGAASGLFWLFLAGYLVTFVRNGFEVLAATLRAGHVVRPDVLIAVPAALGAGALSVASVVGYATLKYKSPRDAGLFTGAFVAVAVFFFAIFAAFAPQFLMPWKRLLGW
jgi:hypothetical protein